MKLSHRGHHLDRGQQESISFTAAGGQSLLRALAAAYRQGYLSTTHLVEAGTITECLAGVWLASGAQQ